jgi:CubicO group peptidase (beta-lactamase class C family)
MTLFQLKFVLVVITAISMVYPGQGQTHDNGNKRHVEKVVDSIVQPLIESSRIAGMAVAVMRNDTILLSKTYGYADLEFNVPLPANASFEIGSITKQFTAVAVMQLSEKGLIDLDDNISKHLDFKPEGITIRQLLTHTSGIKGLRMGDMIYHEYPRDTLLRLIEKNTLDFPPGSMMMYNNLGYNVLGLLIEKVTGQTYGEYLQANIFQRAGMMNTHMSDLQTVVKYRSHGYNNVRDDGKLTRAEQPYFYWTYAAGALSSTVEDLLKWNQVIHRSEKILKRATYQQMVSTGHLKDGTALRYAMGMQVLKYKNHNVIGHGGSGSGFMSDVRYFPDQNLTIITLQNTFRRVGESEISYGIADKLLPSREVLPNRFEGDLSNYKGSYKGLVGITIDLVGADLTIIKPGASKGDVLTYIGNQTWKLGTDEFSFVTENGKVKEIHWDLISAHIVLRKD